MQKPNKLSIIIVNYRSERYLEKCLASIYAESKQSQPEIIVVNNDQETDLPKIAEKYGEVRILNRGKNIGFGAACNYGAKAASGKVLLFLNPDTQFLTDYAKIISDKFMVSGEKAGIIGPKLLTDDGKTQKWCAGKDTSVWQLIKNNFGVLESKKVWESQVDISADWVSGAALAVRAEVFEEVGRFDEKFFMYGEDMDLCRRTREYGYSVFYCPSMSILHSCGKSRESWVKQKTQFYKSSWYYLLKKRGKV